MTRDLEVEEKRILAFYEASLVTAYEKMGGSRPEPAELKELLPDVFEKVQEVIEDEMVSYSSGK
jgi:hypothetical protein